MQHSRAELVNMCVNGNTPRKQFFESFTYSPNSLPASRVPLAQRTPQSATKAREHDEPSVTQPAPPTPQPKPATPQPTHPTPQPASLSVHEEPTGIAEEPNVSTVEPVLSAITVPVAAISVVAAVVVAHTQGVPTQAWLNDKYEEAKERLQLGCHGGMKQQFRSKVCEPTSNSSGHKYGFICHHGCGAKASLAPDWSFKVAKKHGDGCERYHNYRGLLHSEKAILSKHSLTAADKTNSKTAQLRLVTAIDERPPVEGGAPISDAHTLDTPASMRAVRHFLRSQLPRTKFSAADVPSIEALLDRYHLELHKDNPNPPPRLVKVIKVEQWEVPVKAKHKPSVAAAAPRKVGKKAVGTTPGTSTKTVVTETNSMIILSTDALLELMASKSGASIDGTYKCAPGHSTIADFGVFVGRAFVPCCLGIMSGARSGDSTSHWEHFLAAVDAAVHAKTGNKWEPETCVRDHAPALINAINAVWPECLQIVCWFHGMQLIRRRRTKIPALKSKYVDVVKAMKALHYTRDVDFEAAFQALRLKLPAPFRQWFFGATHHGPGEVNEAWTFSILEAGEPCTNSAAESFHSHLRWDRENFNGVSKPGFMQCLGILGNAVASIDTRVRFNSRSEGGLLYCEVTDAKEAARNRRAWREAIAIHDSGTWGRTYKTRGSAFFLPGGAPTTKEHVIKVKNMRSVAPASNWYAYHDLRECTEHSCTCPHFLKYGFCKHAFAVNFALHAFRDVPDMRQRAGDGTDEAEGVEEKSDSDVSADDVSVVEDADDVRDSNSSEDDEELQPLPAVRSRRLALVHNAHTF